MEAARTSETSAYPNDATLCCTSEGCRLHTRIRDSLKSHKAYHDSAFSCLSLILHKNGTERRGRMVNTFASYYDVPDSDLSLETGYPDRVFSWFSSVHLGQCCDSILKPDHDFLSNPL
jgi:hypothetical protein